MYPRPLSLQLDLSSRSERMDRKRQHLQDLVSQQVSFKQLIARNRSPAGAAAAPPSARIALPFIVVNTRKETVIDCEMAEDRQVSHLPRSPKISQDLPRFPIELRAPTHPLSPHTLSLHTPSPPTPAQHTLSWGEAWCAFPPGVPSRLVWLPLLV